MKKLTYYEIVYGCTYQELEMKINKLLQAKSTLCWIPIGSVYMILHGVSGDFVYAQSFGTYEYSDTNKP